MKHLLLPVLLAVMGFTSFNAWADDALTDTIVNVTDLPDNNEICDSLCGMEIEKHK